MISVTLHCRQPPFQRACTSGDVKASVLQLLLPHLELHGVRKHTETQNHQRLVKRSSGADFEAGKHYERLYPDLLMRSSKGKDVHLVGLVQTVQHLEQGLCGRKMLSSEGIQQSSESACAAIKCCSCKLFACLEQLTS
jgi:hypothetical protein